MKTLLIVLLLTVTCCVSYTSALIGTHPDYQCCSEPSQTPILKGRIRHMKLSHSACKHKALLVTTVCNVTFCIDSNWKWAKKALSQFQKSTATGQAPSAPFNVLPCNKRSS